MERARIALRGTAVGDAFGETFFGPPEAVARRLASRSLLPPPWRYTDDTVMANVVTEALNRHGGIEQDALAGGFVDAYVRDPARGYGGAAQQLLQEIARGRSWRNAAPALFSGTGSMGNGGAMRAAPIGAYFAEEISAAAEHARLAAEVTHAHPEGQAGAVAVAVAAAWAWTHRERRAPDLGGELLRSVVDALPETETRAGVERAIALGPEAAVDRAVAVLGNGSKVRAQDTVPLALWAVARHLDDFAEGLWTLVNALGDRDTTCAIAGGVLALRTGPQGIPPAWDRARERLSSISFRGPRP